MLNPIIEQKNLSHKEYERYARQIIIEEIKSEGQNRLKNANVICIGAGGLSSAALLYLTACGIGSIGIVDSDEVELSNLQRQIIYQECNIGQTKAKAAKKNLKSLNSLVNIKSYIKRLTQDNIPEILSNYEIIIDGTDNFHVRHLISRYCYQLHKIHIYGAIEKFTGQVSVFNYQNNGNYYNLYCKLSYTKARTCSEIGIINTLAGSIGLLQASEAIKIITGIGKIAASYLSVFNLLNCSLDKIKIKTSKLLNQKIVKSQTRHQRAGMKYISVSNIHCSTIQPHKIIDIRNSEEFQVNKLPGAISIPLSVLKKKKYIKQIEDLSKQYQIIIYCNTQARSYIASQILSRYSIDSYILGNSDTKEREGFEPSLSNT